MQSSTMISKAAKGRLLDILRQMCIIGDNFTGRISINLNQGAICDIEKLERMK